MFVPDPKGAAKFSAEKMGKADLIRGEQIFAGLNCFEPGQEHSKHCHAGQDKLYAVVSGTAIVTIGDEQQTLGPGGLAFAADNVPHSIRNPGPERLIVMAILAPPPKSR
jgi:mannose-6-phosphate isomerase-like protein (cupin superfamily)